MRKRSVKASEIIKVGNRELTMEQLAAILDSLPEGKEPGWYGPERDDKYGQVKYTRRLDDGSEFVYTVKKGGWLDCQINLRFKNGKPIPGFGGKVAKWATYVKYWMSADFKSDLKIVSDLAVKAERVAAS